MCDKWEKKKSSDLKLEVQDQWDYRSRWMQLLNVMGTAFIMEGETVSATHSCVDNWSIVFFSAFGIHLQCKHREIHVGMLIILMHTLTFTRYCTSSNIEWMILHGRSPSDICFCSQKRGSNNSILIRWNTSDLVVRVCVCLLCALRGTSRGIRTVHLLFLKYTV